MYRSRWTRSPPPNRKPIDAENNQNRRDDSSPLPTLRRHFYDGKRPAALLRGFLSPRRRCRRRESESQIMFAFAFGLCVGGFAGFWGGLFFGGWGFASFVLAVFLVMIFFGLDADPKRADRAPPCE